MARSRKPMGVFIVRLREQTFHFLEPEITWQGATHLGRFQIQRGI